MHFYHKTSESIENIFIVIYKQNCWPNLSECDSSEGRNTLNSVYFITLVCIQ